MINENIYSSPQVIISDSESETRQLGIELAKRLVGGTVVALCGDLGAGKTVFARGLARGLGIEDPVTSPTFTVVQEYSGLDLDLYHIDLYRVEDASDLVALGLEQMVGNLSAVTVVEWAERAEDLLEAGGFEVKIECKDIESRKIEIRYF